MSYHFPTAFGTTSRLSHETSSTSSTSSSSSSSSSQIQVPFPGCDYFTTPPSMRRYLQLQRRDTSPTKSESSYQNRANIMATPAPELWHPESFYTVSDLLELLFPNEPRNQLIIERLANRDQNLQHEAIFALNSVLSTFQEKVDSRSYRIEYRDILYLFQLHCHLSGFTLPICNLIQANISTLYKKMASQLTLEQKGQLVRFANLLDAPVSNLFRSAIFPLLFQPAQVAKSAPSNQWISVQQTFRKIIELLRQFKNQPPKVTIQRYYIYRYLDRPYSQAEFYNALSNLESYCYLSLKKLANGQEVELPKYYYFGCFDKLNQQRAIKCEELFKPLTPSHSDYYWAEYEGVLVSTTLEEFFAEEAIALPGSIEWRTDVTNFGIPDTAAKNGQYWLGFSQEIPLCSYNRQEKVEVHQISALVVKEDRLEGQKLELAKNKLTRNLNILTNLEAKLLNAILLNEFPLFFPVHFSYKTKIRGGARRALPLNSTPSKQLPTLEKIQELCGANLFSQRYSPVASTQAQPFQPPLPQTFFHPPHPCHFHANHFHHTPTHSHPQAPILYAAQQSPPVYATPKTGFPPHVMPPPYKQMAPAAAMQYHTMPQPPCNHPNHSHHVPPPNHEQERVKRAKTANSAASQLTGSIHSIQPILIKHSFQEILKLSSNFYSAIPRKFGPDELLNHPKTQDFINDGIGEWFTKEPNFSLQLFLNQIHEKPLALRQAIVEGFLNNGKELPKNLDSDHLSNRISAINNYRASRKRLLSHIKNSFSSITDLPPPMRHTWADIKDDALFGQVIGHNPLIYFNFKSVQSLLYYHASFVREEIKNIEHLLGGPKDPHLFNGPKATLFDRILCGNKSAKRLFFTFLAFKIIQASKLSTNLDTLECPIHPEEKDGLKAFIDFNTFETGAADGSDSRLTANEPALARQLYNDLSVMEKESLSAYLTGEPLPSSFTEGIQKRMDLIIRLFKEMGDAIASRYFSSNSNPTAGSLPTKLDNSPLRHLLFDEEISTIEQEPKFREFVYSFDHIK